MIIKKILLFIAIVGVIGVPLGRGPEAETPPSDAPPPSNPQTTISNWLCVFPQYPGYQYPGYGLIINMQGGELTGNEFKFSTMTDRSKVNQCKSLFKSGATDNGCRNVDDPETYFCNNCEVLGDLIENCQEVVDCSSLPAMTIDDCE